MKNYLAKEKHSIDEQSSRRSTEQRHLILEIIQQADRHLDADKIFELSRHKLPGISLSTIYRNLQLFKELGVVKEHHFEGRRRYYESTSQSTHQHLVCLGCGRVFEFKCPLADSIKAKIKTEEGFNVTEAKVHLTGYCPECQKKLFGNDGNKKHKIAKTG